MWLFVTSLSLFSIFFSLVCQLFSLVCHFFSLVFIFFSLVCDFLHVLYTYCNFFSLNLHFYVFFTPVCAFLSPKFTFFDFFHCVVTFFHLNLQFLVKFFFCWNFNLNVSGLVKYKLMRTSGYLPLPKELKSKRDASILKIMMRNVFYGPSSHCYIQ